MGLPSGTFWHELPGRLRVTYQGQFIKNIDLGGDTDWRDNASYITLRCYLGEGAGRLTTTLGSATVLELQYPGAYADVPVGMEYVEHAIGGAGSVHYTKLAITCRFEPYVEV